MARVRTKTVGKNMEVPRALTIMYGKNPDNALFKDDKIFNQDFEK